MGTATPSTLEGGSKLKKLKVHHLIRGFFFVGTAGLLAGYRDICLFKVSICCVGFWGDYAKLYYIA